MVGDRAFLAARRGHLVPLAGVPLAAAAPPGAPAAPWRAGPYARDLGPGAGRPHRRARWGRRGRAGHPVQRSAVVPHPARGGRDRLRHRPAAGRLAGPGRPPGVPDVGRPGLRVRGGPGRARHRAGPAPDPRGRPRAAPGARGPDDGQRRRAAAVAHGADGRGRHARRRAQLARDARARDRRRLDRRHRRRPRARPRAGAAGRRLLPLHRLRRGRGPRGPAGPSRGRS